MNTTFLDYSGLLTFVEQSDGRFLKADATRLWGTITTNLPRVNTLFDVRAGDGHAVTLADYENIMSSPISGVRRRIMLQERQDWRVSRALVIRFMNDSVNKTPKDFQEYGPIARKLLAAWLA